MGIRKKEEAVAHFKDMLVLNPNDNQGVRHILVNWLLEIEDYEYFKKLIDTYRDDFFAGMKYSNALHLYKTGKLKEASKELTEAMKANIFIPDYLLGKKRFPEMMPGFIGIGDENEAIFYASEAFELWHKNANAINWLKREVRLFKNNIKK